MANLPNIGPRGRRQRVVFGLAGVSIAVVLAAALLALDVPRAWRLAVFAPLWVAGLGLFQARDKT